MMKAVTNTLGVLMIVLGLIGFLNVGFMGMHLNAAHNILLLVLGGAAMYFGIAGTEFQARYFNRGLGAVMALLGVLGLMSAGGTVGIEALDGKYAAHLLKVLPGHLEFGPADSIANLIIGAVGLIAGFIPRETEIKIDMAAQATKQKAGG